MYLLIASLLFSAIAASLVFLVGRRDSAHDPRLTVLTLVLCGLFPALAGLLPKVGSFPAPMAAGGMAGVPWHMVLGAGWAVVILFGTVRLVLAARGIAVWKRDSRLCSVLEGVEIRNLKELTSPQAGIFESVGEYDVGHSIHHPIRR